MKHFWDTTGTSEITCFGIPEYVPISQAEESIQNFDVYHQLDDLDQCGVSAGSLYPGFPSPRTGGITFHDGIASTDDERILCLSEFYPVTTCFVIACLLPLMRWSQVKWASWLEIAVKIIYIPAVLITYARSCWVGFAVLAACMVYVLIKHRNGKIDKWWILIIEIPALAECLLYILTVVHGKRLGGSVGRVKYWIYTLTVFFPERPLVSKLFGNGFYTSIIMDQTPVAMPGFPANDNAFVTIFYEQGILGFAAVMCLLGRVIKSIWNVDKDWIYDIALISACATACFYEMHFWVQAGFLEAVLIGVFWGKSCAV